MVGFKSSLESIVNFCSNNAPSLGLSLGGLAFTLAYRLGGDEDSSGLLKEAAVYAVPLGTAVTAYFVAVQQALHRQVEELSLTDHLTGLRNKRYFEMEGEKALKRAARGGYDYPFLFFDIDNFKLVNDTLGHREGDRVLREVAATISSGIREGDVIARYGGDEFIGYLDGTSMEGAEIAVGRIAQSLDICFSEINSALMIKTGKDLPRVSISVGIARASDFDYDINTIISAADDHMYAKKLAKK